MDSKPPLDEDGQPPPTYYALRVAERLVAELLGMCKGLICDGAVQEAEVLGLGRWLHGHPDAVTRYPGSVLTQRLVRIFEDGRIDEQERTELHELLCDLTGDTAQLDQPLNLTSRHFFDDPPPQIVFPDREFVFTGRMLYGTRQQCEELVTQQGGRCWRNPRMATDYLVVGPIASAAWIQSTHGLKLLKAAELRDKGAKVRIVDEENWIQQAHPGPRLVP